MLDSSILYIPFDDSQLISKNIVSEDPTSTPKRKTYPLQKKLMLQYEDALFERDLILSNEEVFSFLPNHEQEIDFMDKENFPKHTMKRLFFENNVEVTSDQEIQMPLHKKIKISVENEIPTQKVPLLATVEETMRDEGNLQNMDDVLNVNPNTTPTDKKIKRYFTRCLTRKPVRLEEQTEQDKVIKKTERRGRKKKNVLKKSKKNITLQKEKTSKISRKNSKSVEKNVIQPIKKKRGRPLKNMMQNTIKSRIKTVMFSTKTKALIEQQEKVDDVPKNERNHSSSKASFSVRKSRKSDIDNTDPKFHEPFKYGWRREVVYRALPKQSKADVYYYTPEGEKLRSFVSIEKKLANIGLTLENFTFYRGSVGVTDTNLEIIRHSKSVTMRQRIKKQFSDIVKQNNVFKFKENKLSAPKTRVSRKNNRKQLKNLEDLPGPSGINLIKDTNVCEISKENKNETTQNHVCEIDPSCILQNDFYTQSVNLSTVSENKNGSLIIKNNSITCEDILNATMVNMDETTIPKTANLININEQNNLNNNFKSITSIIDDSTQKIESLPDVLHVQSSLTYPGTLTTITETSKSRFSINNTNENVETNANKICLLESVSDKLVEVNNLKNIDNENINKSQINRTLANHILSNECSTFQDISTTITKSHENSFIIKTNFVNFKTDLNENILLESECLTINDLHNFQDTFNKILADLVKEALNKMKKVVFYKAISKNNSSDNDIFFDNSIEKSMSENNANIEIVQNDIAKNNFSSEINLSKIKQNNILKLNIEKNNLFKQINLNQVPFFINALDLNSGNDIHNVGKLHLPFLLSERIINDTQITLREKMNSFINLKLSKIIPYTIVNKTVNYENDEFQSIMQKSLIITPEKRIIPLNSLKRIKFSMKPPSKNDSQSVKPHSITSFCAGYTALKLIFSYLNIEDLLIARKVSKVWKELVDQTRLWKKVQINNSQLTDVLANILQKFGTQHLLVLKEDDTNWENFVDAISKIKCLQILELRICPATVVEKIAKCCPQLEIINALSIKNETLNLEHIQNLENLKKLYLKAMTNMSLGSELTCLTKFIELTDLSLRSIKNLGEKNIQAIGHLTNLKILELGECSGFNTFGSTVLIKLKNLKRLKLEKIQDSQSSNDILINVSKLEKLTDLALININITTGFNEYLPKCQNLTKLQLIPIYHYESALTNNIILKSTTKLTSNLKHFIWGIPEEIFSLSKMFSEYSEGDWILFLKPIPHSENLEEKRNIRKEGLPKKDLQVLINDLVCILEDNDTSRLDMMSVSSLQKLYATILPKTRLDILKIKPDAQY